MAVASFGKKPRKIWRTNIWPIRVCIHYSIWGIFIYDDILGSLINNTSHVLCSLPRGNGNINKEIDYRNTIEYVTAAEWMIFFQQKLIGTT